MFFRKGSVLITVLTMNGSPGSRGRPTIAGMFSVQRGVVYYLISISSISQFASKPESFKSRE